jgi:hypothetical protein
VHPGLRLLIASGFLAAAALAAPKPHTISLGKWTPVKWCVGPNEGKCLDLKVRALYVDGRMKEYTLGTSHDVTERLFVIRRAFRVNDTLPGETAPRWVWQRGGWLAVERATGHISAINLPEFDSYYSAVGWYRDYAAYCGISDDGKKLHAIVFQLGRRKAVLKRPLGGPAADDMPDSECPAPVWQRQPARVSFEPDEEQKFTYSVRGHAADLVHDDDNESADQEDAVK